MTIKCSLYGCEKPAEFVIEGEYLCNTHGNNTKNFNEIQLRATARIIKAFNNFYEGKCPEKQK